MASGDSNKLRLKWLLAADGDMHASRKCPNGMQNDVEK